MKGAHVARVSRLEGQARAVRPAGVQVTVTRQVMERGPDGVPVPVRVERRTFTLRRGTA